MGRLQNNLHQVTAQRIGPNGSIKVLESALASGATLGLNQFY